MKHWQRSVPEVASAGRFGLGLGLLLLLMAACSPQAQNQATLAASNLLDPNNLCTVSPATATASSFFILISAGLLTGLSHCIGMCGPLVGAFTLRRRIARQEISTPLLIFQMGRLTTYVALGAILGGTGHLLGAAIRDWQGIFSVALGLLMALLGLSLLGLLPLQRWLAWLAPARPVSHWLKSALASTHPAAPFGLGLANGLLPCAPVYAMGLLAAVSGDPLRGAGLMLIFGLGTLPAMLGLGFFSALFSLPLRGRLYRLAAGLVLLAGLQLTLRGLALGGQLSHAAIGSVMLW